MCFLAVKTRIPAPSQSMVYRLRLVDDLNRCLSSTARLALISAPAGSGKTVLLAQWLQQIPPIFTQPGFPSMKGIIDCALRYDRSWFDIQLRQDDLPLGQWKAILLSGLIWGAWHAPTTLLHGYNFPQHPYLGILVGLVGFSLLGVILSWLALKTRSPWAPVLGHGAFNAVAGLIFFFLKPCFDTALAGSPIGLAGWIPLVLFIVCLVAAKQLPVDGYETQN